MGFSGLRFRCRQGGIVTREEPGQAENYRPRAFRESLAIFAIYPVWPEKQIDGRLAE
jgi:hypothetical protein